MTRTCYLLHQGSRNEHFYTFHARPPKVIKHAVRDGETGEWTDFFETPTPFIFAICVYGMKRRMGVDIPIGAYIPLSLEFGEPVE